MNVGEHLTEGLVPARCFTNVTEGYWEGLYLSDVEDTVGCFLWLTFRLKWESRETISVAVAMSGLVFYVVHIR